MSKIIDGKAFADQLCEQLAQEIASLHENKNLQPCIAVVLVGEDPASSVYVNNKIKRCNQLGIESREHRLSTETDQETLLSLIDDLNNDDAVNGILVQLPLPDQINEKAVINAIAPQKDVDGFHVSNAGALSVATTKWCPARHWVQ